MLLRADFESRCFFWSGNVQVGWRQDTLVIEPLLEVCCALGIMAFNVRDSAREQISAGTAVDWTSTSPLALSVYFMLRERDIIVIYSDPAIQRHLTQVFIGRPLSKHGAHTLSITI